MSCCIKRQLFIRKLDIRTVYVKEIEIFREISLFFLSFFALVEKGDVQILPKKPMQTETLLCDILSHL